MLNFRYYGPVEGRIVEIDRSQSDALRLTLDQVVLQDVSPARTPLRVRVSLQKEQDWLRPTPGQVVILTANLAARRPGRAWWLRLPPDGFLRHLGAVGYTRTPVLLLRSPLAARCRSPADLAYARCSNTWRVRRPCGGRDDGAARRSPRTPCRRCGFPAGASSGDLE